MNTNENKTIWVVTNSKGEFLKACENRQKAIEIMTGWRNSCIKVGLFEEVGDIEYPYTDRISFNVIARNGEERTCYARETTLY